MMLKNPWDTSASVVAPIFFFRDGLISKQIIEQLVAVCVTFEIIFFNFRLLDGFCTQKPVYLVQSYYLVWCKYYLYVQALPSGMFLISLTLKTANWRKTKPQHNMASVSNFYPPSTLSPILKQAYKLRVLLKRQNPLSRGRQQEYPYPVRYLQKWTSLLALQEFAKENQYMLIFEYERRLAYQK